MEENVKGVRKKEMLGKENGSEKGKNCHKNMTCLWRRSGLKQDS